MSAPYGRPGSDQEDEFFRWLADKVQRWLPTSQPKGPALPPAPLPRVGPAGFADYRTSGRTRSHVGEEAARVHRRKTEVIREIEKLQSEQHRFESMLTNATNWRIRQYAEQSLTRIPARLLALGAELERLRRELAGLRHDLARFRVVRRGGAP